MNRARARFDARVLDLVRCFLIVAAAVASVRARYAGGVAVALTSAVLLAIETTLPVRFPIAPVPIGVALGAVFLGPSSMPHSCALVAAKLLMDPLHHLAAAALSAIAARGAFARAEPLPPEGLVSRRLDRAGLRFVALGVVEGLLSVSGVIMHLAHGDD
jgi:hypothetical protein